MGGGGGGNYLLLLSSDLLSEFLLAGRLPPGLPSESFFLFKTGVFLPVKSLVTRRTRVVDRIASLVVVAAVAVAVWLPR